MALLELTRGETLRIPALQLPNGKCFSGFLKATDGENLIIELDDPAARLPEKIDELQVATWLSEGTQRACPIVVRSHSPRVLVAQVVIQERREAPRMRIDVQVAYELVPADHVKEVSEEVMAHVNIASEPVAESLGLLNSDEDPMLKLHTEICQLREIIQELVLNVADLTAIVVGGTPPQAPANQPRNPLAVMNCSSTGLGMIATEGLQEGDYLRLALTLRTVPKATILCMGVVVRCLNLERGPGETKTGKRYDIGVRFTHIHEGDRERLIHYLFKVQRKLLRDLKEAREATQTQHKKTFSPV